MRIPWFAIAATRLATAIAWAIAVLATTIWSAASCSTARAAETADASVQSGRAALGSHWSYPWYDESTDGIRVIELKPDAPTAKVSEQEEAAPASLGSASGTTEVVVVVIAAIILGSLVWVFARAYLKLEVGAVVAETRPGREIDIARIEHLPFRVADGKTDLLAEARRLAGQQRYSEAMVYLYSYQLLQLDRLNVIHLAKGKTNRQYFREAARQEFKQQLGTSMIAFEDVFFGHHEIDRTRFEACLAGIEHLAVEQPAIAQGAAR